MTDYELYQILDENGYETTEENLSILKEQIETDTLEEGLTTLVAQHYGKSLAKNSAKAERINQALERDAARGGMMSEKKKAKLQRRAAKAAEKVSAANDYMEQKLANGSKKKVDALQAAANAQEKEDNKFKKTATALRAKYGGGEDGTDKSKDAVAQANLNANKVVGRGKNKDGTDNYGTALSSKEVHFQQMKKAKKDSNLSKGVQYVTGSNHALEESLDIITSLLESNGFEVSDENVVTLCEGILSGDINVLDSSDVVLTEGMDEDYVYMQLLDNNDFEVSENNINVLKEAIENGHILLA